MSTDPYDHLQHELAVLARRSERVRLAAADAARSPLDRSGYLLLAHLDERGEQTMSDLATAFDLDASTVTRQIAPLERRGYVSRARSDVDRRATLVQITDSGRAERELVREARTTLMGRRLAEWSVEDVTALADLLERLNTVLSEADGAAPPS
ncbi:Transcriptional regulator MarR family [Patulibacter medicamentivorans]|uniref:Transcriptional regulator MarR family n=1 Tax=Patulibacter medicamentivorans TaxID=1097667 RepID=H0E0J5_9ACTN|nr:MarR family transcriptional regulator [Patulibacter medicamentivorans]EHN12814.1 Transcriptional regulator MarR family [Patulibacter medicamentivorans]